MVVTISRDRDTRVREVLQEIRALTSELDALLLADEPPEVVDSVREGVELMQSGSTDSDLDGCRVQVLSGDSDVRGQRGRVFARHGSKYWWVKLDDGRKIYRMARNLLRSSSNRSGN